MSFERNNIQRMAGYVSGEQPERDDIIKLNTNENPYPPSPKVAAALSAIQVESLRRYPPPTAMALRKTLAQLHDVSCEEIIVTNGGDELLRLLLATFVESQELIATAAPSYSLYDVLAAAHGCKMQHIALQEDWLLNPDMSAELNAAGIKLCFVVNPNAPSGVLNPASSIEKLLTEFKGLVVLDEAYVDFVDPELKYNCTPLVKKYNNLIILRTYSKGYSLAGLRMAYGIGSAELIDPMQYKTKDSYNTDFIAQTLANASSLDQTYAASTWKKVRSERAIVKAVLEKLGISSPPSQSNFLLANLGSAAKAQSAYQGLKQAGILVRYFNLPKLDDKIRITIGTPAENQKLLSALTALIKS